MESNPSSPSSSPDVDNLADELIRIIESAKAIGEYRPSQSKECISLVRRLNLFLPFLEEIRCLHPTALPDAAIDRLAKLKKAFHSAKKFLKLCQCGSKIFLVLEGEAMMVRCQGVYEKISQALDGMPYDKLGISEDEKEQVQLLQKQLKKAKRRTDTQDMELIMDLMVALSNNNDRNADIASIERLSTKLNLHTPEELKQETIAIQKLVKERKGRNAESTDQIINLLNKFKRLAGVPEDDINEDTIVSEPATKSTSHTVPNEFLCPITLEIMTDPVIIATGQTYERESIQKWLDSNHRTCPKTGQALEHLLLAPNFALENLIVQWCEKNNYKPLPKKKASPAESVVIDSPCTDEIVAAIQSLKSSKLTEQRQAVKKIRMLSKGSPENRTLVANAGGIPPLVQLLSYPDSTIQEQAVTAILNLSIDETNKELISREDALPAIIEILQKGTAAAKENSAAALFSLSMLNENKTKIGLLNGIPLLVDLLKTGTIRGKKDAITAIFNLCLEPSNKDRALEAAVVPPLLKVLNDAKLDMVNETLSTLLILAACPKGRKELGQLPFVETLVKFIREGTPKNQECATAVLVELGSHNSNLILAALQFGVYEHLVEVSKNGTERGRRKVNTMFKLMSKSEQLQ